MSLSKEMNPMSVTDKMKRQSYYERICDDLSEVILQYLPLKDKIRLECVSKQFQRTIFAKQELNRYDLFLFFDNTERNSPTFDLKRFETTLKKCPNIRSIEVTNTKIAEINSDIINRVIELIIKNCHNLSQTNCSLQRMSDQIRQQFIEKFGSKLRHFKQIFDNSPLDVIDSINSFTNIEELFLRFTNQLSFKISESGLKRLKKLLIFLIKTDLNIITDFLINSKDIKVLYICCNVNETDLNTIFSHVLRHKNLIEFKFWSNIGLNDKRTEKCLKQLADNCPKLKSIGGIVICSTDSDLYMSQLLSSFKQFKELKRLGLWFPQKQSIGFEKQLFSGKAFKGLENITHLKLKFKLFANDSILEDIDTNLPKLQYLEIENFEVSDPTPILSRLTELKTIKMKINNNNNNNNNNNIEVIRNNLLKNCKRLKTLEIQII